MCICVLSSQMQSSQRVDCQCVDIGFGTVGRFWPGMYRQADVDCDGQRVDIIIDGCQEAGRGRDFDPLEEMQRFGN